MSESSDSNESLFHSLLNCIPACFVSKDLEGRFLFVNDECANLFGKSADEIVGKSVNDVYTQVCAEPARREDETVMRTGQISEDVFEDTVEEGTCFYASRKGPVRNEQGEIVGVQSIFWDITKRRTAELALLAEREELRAAKEANDGMNQAILDFLEASRKTLDDFPAPLQAVCEALESYLARDKE